MKKVFYLASILGFCKKNWFKLSLALLCLYAWAKKDFTIQFQMGEPDKSEQRPANHKPREKYTDANAVIASEPGTVEKMEVPIVGAFSMTDSPAMEWSSIDETAKRTYLERFAKVALSEQKRYGIPASVILALSLQQSCAGKRDLALQVNNQFALPCSTDWNGTCREFQGLPYRKYDTAWASFRDFSLWARAHLAQVEGKNYKAWGHALEEKGFEGASELPEIIATYRLFELDKGQ